MPNWLISDYRASIFEDDTSTVSPSHRGCIRSTLSGNLLSAAFALSIARPKSDLLLEAIVMDFMDESHLVIKDFPEACYLI
jgi:hypothetical protein